MFEITCYGHRPSLCAIAAIALLAIVTGCADDTRLGPFCSEQATEFQASPEQTVVLNLLVCTLHRQYTPETVPIFIGVRNESDHPQVVRSSFDVFGPLSIRVVDPRGQELSPVSVWEPPDISQTSLPLARHLLARGGVTGRIIDLACDAEELVAHSDCLPLYDFAHSGTYTVTVRTIGVYWCVPMCIPTEEIVDERRIEFPSVEVQVTIES